MAYIKTLKDNELIGGKDNTDVYPVSSTQAIFSQKPDGTIPSGIKHQKLEDRLFDDEEDARELHRKAEKLVAYISNDKASQTLEITGEQLVMNLHGSAQLETFGDEPAETIAPEDMETKKITVSSGSAIMQEVSGVDLAYRIPNVVGQYNARFDVAYAGVPKYAESKTNVNLRKYFGFADVQPTDVTALAVSDFSNSVSCTVTIPANGTGFKHIYFAVPNGMTISRIVQPDALNAPLAITQVGTVSRTIGSSTFTYKLYRSDDLIDSSLSKRLTIS